MTEPVLAPNPVELSQIRAGANLSEDAQAVADEASDTADLFARLVEKELRADALQVFPHLLSKPAAVWWGCLCVWDHLRVENPPPGSATRGAVQAALEWVKEPGDESRRLAEAIGKEVGMEKPSGCLALAAAWSDGSLSAPDLPEVPPPADLTAKLVAGAVVLAAVSGDPTKIQQNYVQFLTLAKQVRSGELSLASDAKG